MKVVFLLWDRIVAGLRTLIPELKIVYKKHDKLSQLISKVYPRYKNLYTAIYPSIYLPDRNLLDGHNPATLEHEIVHIFDQQTFFGLLPKVSAKINTFLFLFLYFTPQVFSILSILAFWNLWWLLCLLFLLPLPSPFRMIIEMRAYRRTRELGGSIKELVEKFCTSKYYWMFPFRKTVTKMLLKDSPYKNWMDTNREIK